MNKRQPLPEFQAFLLNTVMLSACMCLLAQRPALAASNEIEIRGRILVDDSTLNDAMLVVEVDGTQCLPLVMHADGRFALKIPMGSHATLRFEKPGYLTKEILVDTRNARTTKHATKLNRKVNFDVQMSPALADGRMSYAGPVGTITFLNGSGLMKVKYDRTMSIGNSAPADKVSVRDRREQ